MFITNIIWYWKVFRIIPIIRWSFPFASKRILCPIACLMLTADKSLFVRMGTVGFWLQKLVNSLSVSGQISFSIYLTVIKWYEAKSTTRPQASMSWTYARGMLIYRFNIVTFDRMARRAFNRPKEHARLRLKRGESLPRKLIVLLRMVMLVLLFVVWFMGS